MGKVGRRCIRITFTDDELSYIREHYPTDAQCDIAQYLGVSPSIVARTARELGLKKEPGWSTVKFMGRYVRNYTHGGDHLMRNVSIIFLLFCLFGCSSPEAITVEKVRSEYVNKTDTVTKSDTVLVDNSTVIREVRPEDSLLLAQYGIRLREGERMLLFLQKQLEQEKSRSREVVHDTTLVRDTIPQIVPVEKELTWWQRQKIEFGELAMVIMAGLLCFMLVKYKLKR